jgi:hypothetical protein
MTKTRRYEYRLLSTMRPVTTQKEFEGLPGSMKAQGTESVFYVV